MRTLRGPPWYYIRPRDFPEPLGVVYDLYTEDDQTGELVCVYAGYRRREYALRRIRREHVRYEQNQRA